MKKNFLIILSLGVFIFVSSCKKKDDEPTPPDNEDIIATASRQAHDDIVSFTQSQGADVVISLSDVLNANSEPITPLRIAASEDHRKAHKLFKNKAKQFRNIFIPTHTALRTTVGDDNFVLADNAGTYTFNRVDSSWTTHLGVPSDKIIIKFPSDTLSSDSNAILTIFNYNEYQDGNGSYLPTLIDAELYIGTTKYVDVNFSATYTSDAIPVTMDYTLYLKPFTNTLHYTDGGASISLNTSVAKDGESSNIISTVGTVNFFDATKDSVISFSGYAQYRRVKLSSNGNVNIATIEADKSFNGGPSIATYTANADIDIIDNSNGQKVADIEYFVNTNNEVDARIKLVSGSTKTLEEYFNPIIDELEDFSTSIE